MKTELSPALIEINAATHLEPRGAKKLRHLAAEAIWVTPNAVDTYVQLVAANINVPSAMRAGLLPTPLAQDILAKRPNEGALFWCGDGLKRDAKTGKTTKLAVSTIAQLRVTLAAQRAALGVYKGVLHGVGVAAGRFADTLEALAMAKQRSCDAIVKQALADELRLLNQPQYRYFGAAFVHWECWFECACDTELLAAHVAHFDRTEAAAQAWCAHARRRQAGASEARS